MKAGLELCGLCVRAGMAIRSFTPCRLRSDDVLHGGRFDTGHPLQSSNEMGGRYGESWSPQWCLAVRVRMAIGQRAVPVIPLAAR